MASTAKRRTRVRVEGLDHGDNPIPTATRIGNMVFSGGIGGSDRATGKMPDDLDSQVTNMFSNLRAVIEAAGGSVADVAAVKVYMKGGRDRTGLNREWSAMFPDSNDVPSRHALVYDLPGSMLIQCEFTAVLAASD